MHSCIIVIQMNQVDFDSDAVDEIIEAQHDSDWHQIGGRWSGQILKLIAGINDPILGDPRFPNRIKSPKNWFVDPVKSGYADSALIKEIDPVCLAQLDPYQFFSDMDGEVTKEYLQQLGQEDRLTVVDIHQ